MYANKTEINYTPTSDASGFKEIVMILSMIFLFISVGYNVPKEKSFHYTGVQTVNVDKVLKHNIANTVMMEKSEMSTMRWISRYVGLLLFSLMGLFSSLVIFFMFLTGYKYYRFVQ